MTTQTPPLPPTKNCPDCGRSVPRSARKCIHCTHDFRARRSAFFEWTKNVVFLILGAVLALVVPKAWDHFIAHPLNETALLYMRPYDYQNDRLIIGFHVVEHLNAESCSGSHASADPETLRCATDNLIFDPCWRNSLFLVSEVACLRDPWSQHITLLRLTDKTPIDITGRRDYVSKRAWALELANGMHCVAATGATGGVSYSCDCLPDLSDCKGVIMGSLDRKTRVWYAIVAEKGSKQASPIAVRRAWA
jgi:hypothetical protein